MNDDIIPAWMLQQTIDGGIDQGFSGPHNPYTPRVSNVPHSTSRFTHDSAYLPQAKLQYPRDQWPPSVLQHAEYTGLCPGLMGRALTPVPLAVLPAATPYYPLPTTGSSSNSTTTYGSSRSSSSSTQLSSGTPHPNAPRKRTSSEREDEPGMYDRRYGAGPPCPTGGHSGAALMTSTGILTRIKYTGSIQTAPQDDPLAMQHRYTTPIAPQVILPSTTGAGSGYDTIQNRGDPRSGPNPVAEQVNQRTLKVTDVLDPARCPLPCRQQGCDSIFTGKDAIRRRNEARHFIEKHVNGQHNYPCEGEGCFKVYKRKDARLVHERKYHPELEREPAKLKSSEMKRMSSSGSVEHQEELTAIEGEHYWKGVINDLIQSADYRPYILE
ncbi:hypothetical protein P154DRAFT_230799 [Amniculicola lignicola CBS 123094]|uniref:C2H2-type domain-containing protein n=1 Tax=Amniculicola lignicola CBS 123094 TaxID=1392246 RepID=A0A6A5WF34_9PLEO|nr:hypothetical protein P154DRAFT_230799 [Amniculicola lignicola CBS 123094]